jgi:hypothetical protein
MSRQDLSYPRIDTLQSPGHTPKNRSGLIAGRVVSGYPCFYCNGFPLKTCGNDTQEKIGFLIHLSINSEDVQGLAPDKRHRRRLYYYSTLLMLMDITVGLGVIDA